MCEREKQTQRERERKKTTRPNVAFERNDMKKNPNPVAVAVAQIPFTYNSDSHFFISPSKLFSPIFLPFRFLKIQIHLNFFLCLLFFPYLRLRLVRTSIFFLFYYKEKKNTFLAFLAVTIFLESDEWWKKKQKGKNFPFCCDFWLPSIDL